MMFPRLKVFFGKVDTVVARNAFITAVAVGGIKNAACDFGVQYAQRGRDGRSETDWRRVGVFASFGFVWVGGAQYMIFNRIFPRVFPGLLEGHKIQAFKAMVVDQAIHMPMMYLPCFYCIQKLAEPGQTISGAVQSGMQTWRTNVLSDTTLQLGLFVPFQLMNFTLVPPHFRVPCLITFGLIWVGLLSYRRGGKVEEKSVETCTLSYRSEEMPVEAIAA